VVLEDYLQQENDCFKRIFRILIKVFKKFHNRHNDNVIKNGRLYTKKTGER